MGYKTKQGELIFGILEKNADRHLTAEEICVLLKAEGNAVGTTTVYRNLEKLIAEGKIRRFRLEEGEPACYQYLGGECHEHFHLKCENCGDLIHMDCHDMTNLAEHIKSHHGFAINPLKTVLYGVCERCRTK